MKAWLIVRKKDDKPLTNCYGKLYLFKTKKEADNYFSDYYAKRVEVRI